MLRISKDLSLPDDAVTQKLAFLGTSGSGKSFTAQKLAELMLDIGAQTITVDPVGIWWSLRLLADGKRQGYSQVRVFGGDHGDLPLTKESGKLVARLLAERRISAVLDVSNFTTGEMKFFLTNFAEQFFHSKKAHKSPVHLFLEECQTYIPEHMSEREDGLMVNRWERLIKLYRNYGGGVSMISQQPQSVSKKVLNLADTLFAMRTIGSHERGAILRWVKDVIESESDLVKNLPKLETGTAHIWSPSWLKISRDVKILPKITFDAGKTPEMGVSFVEPKPLTKIDIEQLQVEMSEMIEKVKQEDPRELKKQILELKQQLAKQKPAEPKIEVRTEKIEVRVPVLDEKKIERLGKELAGLTEKFDKILSLCTPPVQKPAPTTSMFPSAAAPAPWHKPKMVYGALPATTRMPIRAIEDPDCVPYGDSSAPSGLKLKILQTLREWEALGHDKVNRDALSALVDARGGYYSNTLGSMRTEELISYPEPGYIQITSKGASFTTPASAPQTSEEILQRVLKSCSGLETRIVQYLHEHNRIEGTHRDQLSEAVAATGGYYSNTLGALRTRGVIIYPSPGMVKIASWMFL